MDEGVRVPFILALAVLTVALARAAGAQADTARTPGTPREGPPIRRISTASAVSREPLGSIDGVRELPDGRVLVNDGESRRLLLIDTMLVTQRVVLDSASDRENTYGTAAGMLFAHRGDSSLFIDREALAMLVIDPSGQVVRVRSVPRARDARTYASGRSSGAYPATDARGRIVYRVRARAAPPTEPPPRGVPWVPQEPDSAFLVALDLETRTLDTLGAIRIPKREIAARMRPGGGYRFAYSMNPMPSTDVWAVLADGAVAFVRAIDYSVDILGGDGSWTSTGKIPFDWQPIPDAEKLRIVDSVRTTLERNAWNAYTTSVIQWVNRYRREYPPNFRAPDGYRPPNGFLQEWRFPPGVSFPDRYIYGCPPGVLPTVEAPADDSSATADRMDGDAARSGPPRGRPSCIPQPIPNLARIPEPPTMRDVNVVSAQALPDYRPPFEDGAALADLDGNLWIEIEQARREPGGPVYDVVRRDGALVDRLQVPPGHSLVGFGRGRVVFLERRDRSGVHLARVRLR